LEGFTIIGDDDDDDDAYCERCGRDNHIEQNCYATRDINGCQIEDDSSDDSEYYSDTSSNVDCCIQ
jgi:hypothetical protein